MQSWPLHHACGRLYGSRTMYGFAEVFLPLLQSCKFLRWKFWNAFPLANHDVQRWKLVAHFSDRTSTFHLSTSFRWKMGFLECLRYITLSFLPESTCHHHPCWWYWPQCVHDRRVQQHSWASFFHSNHLSDTWKAPPCSALLHLFSSLSICDNTQLTHSIAGRYNKT